MQHIIIGIVTSNLLFTCLTYNVVKQIQRDTFTAGTILNDTILFENKKNIKMSLSIIPCKNLVISHREMRMNSYDLLNSLGLVLCFLICSTMYNIF